MNLPPLKALACFEAVARLNSFSRAADAMHVGQSAISHQIRQLEDYLGEVLFLRQGRSLSLTREGQVYYDHIATALKQIERASATLQGQDRTQLRFALYSSLAVRWFIPRMPKLQAEHPTLDLSLEMSTENPTLSARTADCFVTMNPNPCGFTVDLLYSERLFAICSQPFWQQICKACNRSEDPTEPLAAEHLHAFPLLSAYSVFRKTSEDWRRYLAAADLTLQPQTKLHQFSHILLALEAARHHQGIALSNDYMYSAPDDPDLIRLPCHTYDTGDSFYFAFKTSRRADPAIQALRQWLQTEARASGLIGP